MDLTSYNSLVSTVESYLARSDLTPVIPTFVMLAQKRMSRDLRTREMLKVATTTATDNTVELPNDFLEMREIHFQGNPPITLEYESPDKFFRDFLTTTSGLPYYYTILAYELQFAPAPDSQQTLQMLYYAEPTFISSTTASNLYLANYPDALLYATLAEAEAWLMNDDKIQKWASMYDRAIANIMNSDIGKKFPNTALNVTLR
jgi:hypothetical protein